MTDVWRRRAFVSITLVNGVLLLAALFWLVGRLATALAAFLVAALLTYLGRPLVEFLERRGVGRGWGTLLVVVLAVLVLAGFGLLLPGLVTSVVAFFTTLPATATGLFGRAAALVDRISRGSPETRALVQSALQRAASLAADEASAVGGIVLQAGSEAFFLAVNFLLGVVLAVWFLKDGPMISRALLSVIPKRYRDDVAQMGRFVDTSLGGYLRGTLATIAVTFAGCWIGLAIVRVPHAGLLAFVIGVFEVVPFVGPIISGALAVLVALSVSPLTALLTLAVIVGVEQFTDSVVGPVVMGHAVALHPVAVILAITVGLALGGLLGAIAAIPIAAALKSAVVYYHERSAEAAQPPPAAPPPAG